MVILLQTSIFFTIDMSENQHIKLYKTEAIKCPIKINHRNLLPFLSVIRYN